MLRDFRTRSAWPVAAGLLLFAGAQNAPAQERRRLTSLVKGPDLSPWQRGRTAFMAASESPADRGEQRQEALFNPDSG